MPYSWIAVALLTAALAGSGLLLKGAYETNGELKSATKEQQSKIEEMSKAAENQAKEVGRLNKLLEQREVANRDHTKKAEAGKEIVRVESVKPTHFGRCSDILLPADAVHGLRSGAGQAGEDSKGVTTDSPDAGLPAPANS